MSNKVTPPTISIVIVNWNRCDELRKLLSDLQDQAKPADETIIVDNGSSDGSSEMVEREFPHVRLIRLHKNMGLSFGRNVGILAAKSDLVAILDNDLRILDQHFLEKMYRSTTQYTDCGVISFYCITGIWSCPDAQLEGRILALSELRLIAEAGRSPTPSRSFYDWFLFGGACVIRRQVFESVGLFDDAFHYGGEEWDFAYRCHAAGIRLLRDGTLWVVHARSPRMRSASTEKMILQNMVFAQARYMPLTDLVVFLGVQFTKSLTDAATKGTIGALCFTCWRILVGWRNEVTQKRMPLSRQVMRRFYYLRMYQPENYADVEASSESILDFYRHRRKASCAETSSSSKLLVSMSGSS